MMQEAVASYHSPSQLRFLFARIILEGHPACPIWHEYQQELTADFLIRYYSLEQAIDHTLQLESGISCVQSALAHTKRRPTHWSR